MSVDLDSVAYASGDHFVSQSTTSGVQTYALENAGHTVTYAQLNFAGTSSASEFGLGSDHNTGTLVTFVP